MIIENHTCYECGKVEDKQVLNSKIRCSFCKVENDIWFSKFSIGYARHFLKQLRSFIKN